MTKEQLRVVNRALEDIGLENIKNIVLIKEGATNGDVIKVVFPMSQIIYDGLQDGYVDFCMSSDPKAIYCVSKDWWNSPYKAESEV